MNYNGFIKWAPNHYRYIFQPGNGTRYGFSLLKLGDEQNIEVSDYARYKERHKFDLMRLIIEGAKRDSYYTLTAHFPIQGSYEVAASSLRNPIPPFVDYVAQHFPANCSYNRHVLAVIILAASVLVNDPEDLEMAAKKMLTTNEFLRGE